MKMHIPQDTTSGMKRFHPLYIFRTFSVFPTDGPNFSIKEKKSILHSTNKLNKYIIYLLLLCNRMSSGIWGQIRSYLNSVI